MEKVLSLSLEESNFTTGPPATETTPVSTLKYARLDAIFPMRLAAQVPIYVRHYYGGP